MTSLSFTGDIAFSKYFKDSWKEDFLDKQITDFLKESNHVIANVEAPLTSQSVSSTRELNHFCDTQAGSWFKNIYADIWTLANNHILDCTEQGMLDTIKTANQNGAITIGAGTNIDQAKKPAIIDKEGGIGILAVTYKRGEFIRATSNSAGCLLFDEPKRIKQAIKEIKAKNRWCVVIAHGGNEFAPLPMPYNRKLYKKFLKMGADVVVGHHPHVVQGYEKVKEKMIFYSLGNFVFDTDYQRQQRHSQYGILLKLAFDKESFTWEYIATQVNRQNQTVEKTDAPTIFRQITNKSFRILWPIAARVLLGNFQRAKRFAIPKTREYNRLQWFNFFKEKTSLTNALCTYIGKYISYIPFWKKADKEMKDYLLGSVPNPD